MLPLILYKIVVNVKMIIKKTLKFLRINFFLPIVIFFSYLFLGWGYVGHSIINYNTILTALPQMEFFDSWASIMAAHGSDADNRKSSDPTESPKHYIDIDNYPEFVTNGVILQNFDSLVALHGYSFVMDQGILPWAIIAAYDSLQSAFEKDDWDSAVLIAADLGHYIGDSHMPLHITRNYNGQYTNQYGVHSRYESNLISKYQDQIKYSGDSLQYIDNIHDYVFNMIYDNYNYVDSVLYADSLAHAFAGNTTDTVYYNKFWQVAKNFTIGLFKKASYRLTCVIYTALVNAQNNVSNIAETKDIPLDFILYQNYPNPFNPVTRIKYSINASQNVTLKIYDIQGKEIETLVNREQPAGIYEVNFDGNKLCSGIYFYKLKTDSFIETKKMILLK